MKYLYTVTLASLAAALTFAGCTSTPATPAASGGAGWTTSNAWVTPIGPQPMA
jgi:hypothetical protein